MGGIFNLDSKFMYYANKFADLMGLSLLALVCCMPIFTIGASLTALHYVVLRIYRNEEGYIMKSFFKSFKENFKQSTIIWMIYLAMFLLIAFDYWVILKEIIQVHKFIKYGLGCVTIFVVFSFMWVFVLQSRYTNTVKRTIKNAIVVGSSHFLYSIMMILMACIPVLGLMISNIMVPITVFFGLSVPALLQCMLYSRVFDRMEGVDRKKQKEVDDGWSVELPEETQEENKDTLENMTEDGQFDGEKQK